MSSIFCIALGIVLGIVGCCVFFVVQFSNWK